MPTRRAEHQDAALPLARAACAVAAALALLLVSGCGGGSGPATSVASSPSSLAVRGELAGSTSCSVSGSGAGTCLYVFADRRRYRCPLRFSRTPKSEAAIAGSSACVERASIEVPAALQPVGRAIVRTRDCLDARGVRAVGGLAYPLPPPSPDSRYAPAGEVDINGAIIGFYRDAHAAAVALPAIARNTSRIHGAVEPLGASTAVWLRSPSARIRAVVRACVRP